MKDLTAIFLTVNRVPEGWARYHRKVLEEALGDTPVISISAKPMDWGTNLIQEETPSVNNIYKQLLRGCELATTDYISVVEDDTLYHKSHFEFRPPMDKFAYNFHRWGIFTWGNPTFYYKDRISNACMIAPRKLAIERIKERLIVRPNNQWGELGKEKNLSLSFVALCHYYSDIGTVYFSHVNSLDPTEQHKSKKMGTVQAYDIPHWGSASELVKKWWEE